MSKQSNKAHKDIMPRKGSLKARVLTLLSSDGFTLHQVSKRLSMPIQTASARVSELQDEGLIFQSHTGLFRITPPELIESYRDERNETRYSRWKALGEKEGWFTREWGDEMTTLHSGK